MLAPEKWNAISRPTCPLHSQIAFNCSPLLGLRRKKNKFPSWIDLSAHIWWIKSRSPPSCTGLDAMHICEEHVLSSQFNFSNFSVEWSTYIKHGHSSWQHWSSMISYDHWSQQTLSKTELGVHCNQVPLLLPFLPLLFFKLAFLCHSCQSPFNRLPGYMDGWTVGGWLFVWTGGGRALMSHSLQSSLYSAYMSTASGGQGRSCSKYTLGIMLFWFCWISPDMHSCKKCFCLREPVFGGEIFLILRRNFTNMEKEFS